MLGHPFPALANCFVDVFGGSGTVLLSRPLKKGCVEIYNDYNSNLTNLFYCIKNRPLALLKELAFLPLNSRDGFNVLLKFFKKEEFTDEYLEENLELAKVHLAPPEYEQVRGLLLERASLGDVTRAANYYRLIRYSYNSNTTAFAGRACDIRQFFHLIWDCSRRFARVVVENKDLEAYGFKRVCFVLSNTLREMAQPRLVSEEVRKWSQLPWVPPDGKRNRQFAVEASAPQLEALIRQTRAAYQALGLFGPEHCAGDPLKLDYEGKVLVLSPDALRESHWNPREQLWLGQSGFGCSPNARGQAVYAVCLGDGEEFRWNRYDFSGVLDEQYLPDWAAEKLAELQAPQQEQPEAPSGGMEMT
jgi:hypothetical protein